LSDWAKKLHKSKAAEKAIKDRGARILFLPPYSPDLNPIEMAFAQLKAHLAQKRPGPSMPSGTRSGKSGISSRLPNAKTTSPAPDVDSAELPAL
jgi:hypothetical protein